MNQRIEHIINENDFVGAIDRYIEECVNIDKITHPSQLDTQVKDFLSVVYMDLTKKELEYLTKVWIDSSPIRIMVDMERDFMLYFH